MRTLLIALAPILIVTAIAAPGIARDRNQVPEATPAGKSESCIQLNRIRQSHVRSDQVIDFEMQGGKIYRNTLPQSCPGLGFEESFSYKTSLNQLCSVDIITVLQSPPTIRGASCGLGQFQPVTLVKKAKR
ncbi:hypothetical protein [Sphingomonas alpina]|uniref:Uncharacterized protein n=1 Tax=Sphingomonas alpina TaxID=653931 RepID=A0A7H0LJP6_9SPHN|nr:hypothetical protein [Sphingomonas alpina]QNQ09899.1 hypothetical protein H3Z74_01175 [Sphingomonas alpina]